MTRPVGTDVGTTLREMWATRPARDAEDRKIAGVAAAVARRYAVDPTLVRVGFVVAAFYGVGVLLYLAGWLALPERTGTRRVHPLLVVAAVVVGLATLGGAVGGGPRVVIGLAVVGALLYALHHSRAHLAASGAAGATASGTAGDAAGAERPAGQEGDHGSATASPPGWDPLGAAPFAWDLPEPCDAPTAPRSRLVPVTLVAALVAAGAVAVLGLVGVLPLGVTPVVGTALAVVGFGLVVGAFRRTGRGLIVAAIPLALVLMAAAGPSGPPWADGWRDGPGGFDGFDGFGDVNRGDGTSLAFEDGSWAPVSAAAVAPSYSSGAGDARLDLRALPPGPPVITSVESGAGDVRVRVGPTADVTADCASGVGDVDCLGRGEGRVVDLGPDGPGGPVVMVRAQSGAGEVEVDRDR